MSIVLAISGGVDSMLLLERYAKIDGAVVAHFDHGTRPSSKEDAEFVKKAARKYHLPFYLGHGNLGENVSEADARVARYQFLEKVASEVDGKIYTAHHIDDLIESIAINLLRGTGWRGLTPFGSDKIIRPFLKLTLGKRDILTLAEESQITFRQDPTNTEENYLRNRIRPLVMTLGDEIKVEIYELYLEQQKLRTEIERIISGLLPEDNRYERNWFLNLDDMVAMELLRVGLERSGVSATRPQTKDFLVAIKEYSPEKKFNLPGGKLVTLHKTYFVL